ncbi:unnamed protein product, partial [Porites evermanni]
VRRTHQANKAFQVPISKAPQASKASQASKAYQVSRASQVSRVQSILSKKIVKPNSAKRSLVWNESQDSLLPPRKQQVLPDHKEKKNKLPFRKAFKITIKALPPSLTRICSQLICVSLIYSVYTKPM